MAGGAVALEAWLPRLAKPAFAALVLAVAALTAPLFLPVLPVEGFIAYERAIGFMPSTGERFRLGDLPQYYADMFGWPEMAETVGKAYQALPPDEKARAVFFAWNYGDAAAVDFFGARWGLPPAISGHENYFLWGPRGADGSVVLILGGTREGLLKMFRTVEPVGRFDNPLAMPEESGQTLWLCRDMLEPIERGLAAAQTFRLDPRLRPIRIAAGAVERSASLGGPDGVRPRNRSSSPARPPASAGDASKSLSPADTGCSAACEETRTPSGCRRSSARRSGR